MPNWGALGFNTKLPKIARYERRRINCFINRFTFVDLANQRQSLGHREMIHLTLLSLVYFSTQNCAEK